MANARDVTLDLVGKDKTKAATVSAGNNFDRLKNKVEAANRKASQSSSKMGRILGNVSKRMGVVGKITGKTVGGLGNILGKLPGPIGVAGVAISAFAASTVKAAAEAEQSIGGVQAVFGKYFRLVERDSERAADKFGMTATQYQTAATLIGGSLKNQGVAVWKLSGLTKKYIDRGADLAAMYGGTAVQAVDAFTSAMKGEFDPLERLNITLKQSMINTESYRLAKVKTAKEWDKLPDKIKKAATQQALWNLIQKNSKDAEGAANRERGSTMALWGRLKALWANLSTELGKALLPAVNRVMGKIITWVKYMTSHKQEAVQFFADMAAGAIEGFQQIILGMAGMAMDVLGMVSTMAESWNSLPFVKKKVDLSAFSDAQVKISDFANNSIDKLNGYKKTVNNLPKEYKLRGNIKDLQTKIADAEVKLKGVHNKKTEAKVKADITQLKAQLAKAKAALAAIDGTTAETYIRTHRDTYYGTHGEKPPTNPHGDGKSAGGDSWVGSAPGGSYRSGGPRIVMGDTNVATRVFIDGRELRHMAQSAVLDEKRRSAFAARVGRR